MEFETDTILEANLEKAYIMYNILKEDKPEIKKYYEQIRYGTKIGFDLYEYLNENYYPKPKDGIIIIENKNILAKDFYTELETREALIKKILLENSEKEEISKPR